MLNTKRASVALPSSSTGLLSHIYDPNRDEARFPRESLLSSSPRQKINFTAQTNNFLTTNKRQINQWTNYSSAVACGLSFILANTGTP